MSYFGAADRPRRGSREETLVHCQVCDTHKWGGDLCVSMATSVALKKKAHGVYRGASRQERERVCAPRLDSRRTAIAPLPAEGWRARAWWEWMFPPRPSTSAQSARATSMAAILWGEKSTYLPNRPIGFFQSGE